MAKEYWSIWSAQGTTQPLTLNRKQLARHVLGEGKLVLRLCIRFLIRRQVRFLSEERRRGLFQVLPA